MNLYKEIENIAISIIKLFDAKSLKNSLKRLFKQIDDNLKSDKVHIFLTHSEILLSFIKSISENGKPSEKDYEDMRNKHSESQIFISENFEVSLYDPKEIDFQILDVLDIMGGILKKDDRHYTFFIFPEMLLLSLRLLSILESNDRKKHIEQILKLRNEFYDKDIIDKKNTKVEIYSKLFQNKLLENIKGNKYLLNKVSVKNLNMLKIEYLPTATDFYEAGISYYQNDIWEKQRYNIFATTSGIILPEEHYGRNFFKDNLKIFELYEESEKHPIRAKYFDVLSNRLSRIKLNYFFELKRASVAYKKNIKKIELYSSKKGIDIYNDFARKSIMSFLEKNNFNLFVINEFPDEFDYFTLGNGKVAILSGRDNKPRSIGHGFKLYGTENLFKFIIEDIKSHPYISLFKATIPNIDKFINSPNPFDNILESIFRSAFGLLLLGTMKYIYNTYNYEMYNNMLLRLNEEVNKKSTIIKPIKLSDSSRSHNIKADADKIIELLNEPSNLKYFFT
ncbi:MAG: hypothetical protein HW421_1941 [Ignavibacteria bacterium]|nr:hypothetical protein [Ignavibacteria bacterium]